MPNILPASIHDDSLIINYNIPGLPLYIQRNEFLAFCSQKTAPHWSEELITVYVESGCLNIIINGESVNVNSREICVINAGCVHYYVPGNDSSCVFYIGLVSENLFSNAPAIHDKYLLPLFHSFHPNFALIRSDCPDIQQMRDVFSSIIQLLTSEEAGFELLISAKFHEYLVLLYRSLKDNFFLSQPINSSESITFRKMLNYVYQHYSDKILIDDIAAAGGISRKQCYNLFHKYTSSTPAEYIMSYRLTISQKLLADTNETIADIADMCGFTHQSHFTNHFSRHFGVTPNKYRHSSQITSFS